MKNILVSTDFSQPAYGAAIFAAELAKRTGARLILFHAYYPAILLAEESIWADNEMLENEVQEKIDSLAHELHKIYGVSVTRVLKPGFAVDEILIVSEKLKADLLIIGTQGAGKRPKTGPGKICSEILKKAEIPVICMPPETSFGQFSALAKSELAKWKLGNKAGVLAFQNLTTNFELVKI